MRDVRRAAAIALGLGACLALPARAQTPDQPNLIFTISGGMLTGVSSLWRIPQQLAIASIATGYTWDTVALGRKLRPGFAATLSATYFRSPHLGYSLEAGFFGIGTEAECSPVVAFHPTPNNVNQKACTYLQGQNLRGDAVGLLAGLVWRFTTGGPQPYLRAAAGGAIFGSSFAEAVAPVLVSGTGQSTVWFLADQNHKEVTWMVSLGAGVMLPLASSYQLRVEARDLIVALPYPTGPATDTGAVANSNALPQPRIALKAVHVPTFMIGLDVVLERRRGRRY
jgi:hypothetical protein